MCVMRLGNTKKGADVGVVLPSMVQAGFGRHWRRGRPPSPSLASPRGSAGTWEEETAGAMVGGWRLCGNKATLT